MFRTTDTGANWTDISSNLPNAPVNALVVNPKAPSQIFVATDIGVLYTANGGASWTTLNAGLPHVAVLGLALDSASGTLRAATHGRSAWDLSIAGLPLAG